MFIDSHAHLSAIEEALVDDTLQRASIAKLSAIVNIATDQPSLERGLILKNRSTPSIYLTAATTPHDVAKDGGSFFKTVEEMAAKNELSAIGETGLDYHYTYSPKDVQKHFFEKYLDLAKRYKKGVVIHCRDAFDDLFAMIDALAEGVPILLHCFTGTADEAKRALDRGYKISFSGILTFAKSIELHETCKLIPLTQMLIETDSPYLAPVPYRGGKNEPSFVVEVAKKIADLKGVSLEEVAKATSLNAHTFFHMR